MRSLFLISVLLVVQIGCKFQGSETLIRTPVNQMTSTNDSCPNSPSDDTRRPFAIPSNLKLTEVLVQKFYKGVLDREADPTGLSHFKDLILQSGWHGIDQTLTLLTNSVEFNERIKSRKTNDELLAQFYENLLGPNRPVDNSGSATFIPMLQAGRYAEVAIALSSSEEFWSKLAPLPIDHESKIDEAVKKFYQGFLGRDPDVGGHAAHSQRVKDRRLLGYLEVVTAFVRSEEFLSIKSKQSDQELIDMMYQGLLGREPDPDGATAFSCMLKNNQHERAAITIAMSAEFLEKLTPRVIVTSRPLVGPLRVQNKLFADNTGYRRVFFVSWFPALRILRDNPTEFYRQLNEIARAGYQGVRVFWAVGGYDSYWSGREVVPVTFKNDEGREIQVWPDYDDLFREMLRAFRERKLRLHLTSGDMQYIYAGKPHLEVEKTAQLARIAAEEGGSEVVAVWEAHNELWQNSIYGDTPEQVEQDRQILSAVKRSMPEVLTMRGALSEEPEDLYRSSIVGEVCAVHGTRDPAEDAVRRAFGLFYWEGHPRSFPKPYWQGEPTGPDGDTPESKDVYLPMSDRGHLLALYGMHAVTGQASNFFNGPGVRARTPLEVTWGFYELPALLSYIPEDIGTWSGTNAPGGGIYYWSKGKQFVTVTVEGWNYLSTPFPVKSWVIIGPDNIQEGEGALPILPKGYKGRIILGTWQ